MSRSIAATAAAAGVALLAGLANAQHYPIYCKSNGYCHVPPLPDTCTNDSQCKTPWYDSYCVINHGAVSGTCHLELPPKCTTDADCQPKQAVTAGAKDATFEPPVVGKICVNNAAGFVLHWDMRDLLTDKTSEDSGSYPIDQARCLSIADIPDIQDRSVVMCRVHAVAGETQDCADAVVFGANSTETATFHCSGTTLDYSCALEQ